MDERSLEDIVRAIIEDAGFSEEMYIFIDRKNEIFIDFDDRSSAEYLLRISNEPEWRDLIIATHILAGKRHRISFLLW